MDRHGWTTLKQSSFPFDDRHRDQPEIAGISAERISENSIAEQGRDECLAAHNGSPASVKAAWPTNEHSSIPCTTPARETPEHGTHPLLNPPSRLSSLHDGYKKRDKPRKFFKIGKVFQALWSEPADEGGSILSGESWIGKHGEHVFSTTRRFVVIHEFGLHCVALPITTYRGRGVSKPDACKAEHGIIYTGRQPPQPRSDELPGMGELPMQPIPIRIDAVLGEKLDSMSRIIYSRPHTIQHNLKVKSIGMVIEKDVSTLLNQFNTCWNSP